MRTYSSKIRIPLQDGLPRGLTDEGVAEGGEVDAVVVVGVEAEAGDVGGGDAGGRRSGSGPCRALGCCRRYSGARVRHLMRLREHEREVLYNRTACSDSLVGNRSLSETEAH